MFEMSRDGFFNNKSERQKCTALILDGSQCGNYAKYKDGDKYLCHIHYGKLTKTDECCLCHNKGIWEHEDKWLCSYHWNVVSKLIGKGLVNQYIELRKVKVDIENKIRELEKVAYDSIPVMYL